MLDFSFISGHRPHSRGKCRDFPQERCTFTPGLPGYLLHRPLSSHLPFLSPGKVPGFPAILVHFHPWLAGTPAPQPPLVAPAVSFPGESAGNSCENGSLSPAVGRGTASTGLSRDFGALSSTACRATGSTATSCRTSRFFPPCHEASGKVQQGLLGKVLSIQAL